ncbi:aldehyde dehydrogenase family protein [Acidocella sp.]|uniref:aldehyde dehydrogenase family protein n=1 Tax=Acidocella sp. TaxID=50710 RepID=UPI002630CBAE|nr:aldehyde dehydrogenase family protein [Acidocella sp.]
MNMQQTITPVDGSVYVERPYADATKIGAVFDRAVKAQRAWALTTLEERAALCHRFCDALLRHTDEIALEISWSMGRPISQTPSEVRSCAERARFMIDEAPAGLATYDPGFKPGFKRYIKRTPLGVVFVIAPWNYPLLTTVNSVIPAIMAGNAVVLKHAPQTQLCAERFFQAFEEAGLPAGVFQYLHLTNRDAEGLIGDTRVAHVNFTGSVATGHLVQRAAAGRFISVGLELGGKDPGYVRADADVKFAAETLLDGAFFNSGQCCCGIERIYAHESVYEEFLEHAVAIARAYRLGNPMQQDTNLGPVVSARAAANIRAQMDEAIAQGARALIAPEAFTADAPGTAYMAPQILVDVDHSMRFMTEETFGPTVGIMKVKNDDDAVAMMNDSHYGLTAAIFTRDLEAAETIGDRCETGTVFLNRCDALDPALPWVGVKDTGRGYTLSRWGYETLTRPKSYHLRLAE